MSPSSNLPEPLQVLKLHLPHLSLQLSSVPPCLEQGNTTIPEMYGWGTNSCSPAQQGHTATRGGWSQQLYTAPVGWSQLPKVQGQAGRHHHPALPVSHLMQPV